MRNIIILFVILFSFSCTVEKQEEEKDNLKFVDVIPGGCAIDETKSLKSSMVENDTVSYSIKDGELNLLVGFNATCCGEYITSSVLKNDTIRINIKISKPGSCNCICFYTYNFKYSGMADPYYYLINVDEYLFFNGLIKP